MGKTGPVPSGCGATLFTPVVLTGPSSDRHLQYTEGRVIGESGANQMDEKPGKSRLEASTLADK
jgi:hypothetical protein